jgi:hypothetical protein
MVQHIFAMYGTCCAITTIAFLVFCCGQPRHPTMIEVPKAAPQGAGRGDRRPAQKVRATPIGTSSIQWG